MLLVKLVCHSDRNDGQECRENAFVVQKDLGGEATTESQCLLTVHLMPTGMQCASTIQTYQHRVAFY